MGGATPVMLAAAGLGPLFAGETDLDQLGRVTTVLGSIDDASWPAAKQLPDYGKASTTGLTCAALTTVHADGRLSALLATGLLPALGDAKG